MKPYNVFYVIFAVLVFSSCGENSVKSCINSMDCREGQECRQGICVEGTGTNDNTAKTDNEVNDWFATSDDTAVSDDNGNDNENNDDTENDIDEISDDEIADNEINDEEVLPESCGALCGDVVTNNGIQSDCRCEPVKHFDNLANPDIYRDSNNLYFISGTGLDTNSFVVSKSSDLVTFEEAFIYTPSKIDEIFDYCCVSAPEIYKTPDSVYNIYFSAKRVAEAELCDCTDVSNVTAFFAEYDDIAENFKAPSPVDFGEGNPQYRIESDCSVNGCEKTIRTDCSLFNDNGTQWFFWTWFQDGNNISSIKMDDPATVITNFQPTGIEGKTNEGADVFKRDGKYYLFFSIKPLGGGFIMKYVVADTVEELVRNRVPRSFSTPVRGSAITNLQTHGHSSVVERYGDHYIFYQQENLDLLGFDTYKSRLHFREDGSLQTLNTIDIGWSDGGVHYQYRIDIKPKGKDWIESCFDTKQVLINRKQTFTGICPGNLDQIVHKGTIEKIRLYYADDGIFVEPNMVEVDYDGFSSDISIKIPDKNFSHLKIRFAQQKTNDLYRIDIKVKEGEWAPCVGSANLSKPLSLSGDFAYTFNGTCTDVGNEKLIPIESIEAVRVCSGQEEPFIDPVCFEKNYDGSTGYIEVW